MLHLDVATVVYLLQSDTSTWDQVKPKSHKGFHTDWCLAGKDYRDVPNRKSAHSCCLMQPKQLSEGCRFLNSDETSILLLTELVQLDKMCWLLGTDVSLHLFSIKKSCKNVNSDAAHPSRFAQCLKPSSWWNAGLCPTFNLLTDDSRFSWNIWTWFSFTVYSSNVPGGVEGVSLTKDNKKIKH